MKRSHCKAKFFYLKVFTQSVFFLNKKIFIFFTNQHRSFEIEANQEASYFELAHATNYILFQELKK